MITRFISRIIHKKYKPLQVAISRQHRKFYRQGNKTKELHAISNVFDAALLRLDIVFSDYEKVCISLSGGKSSTVLLRLAATVAKAHGKMLTVLFIDQEQDFSRTTYPNWERKI